MGIVEIVVLTAKKSAFQFLEVIVIALREVVERILFSRGIRI